MKVKKDNCKFNKVNWPLGIPCKKKSIFSVWESWNQSLHCIHKNLALDPTRCTITARCSPQYHCVICSQTIIQIRLRAVEKQVKIVTHRNSLINEKPVDKLSLTTDKTWKWLKHHSSNKHFQGILSLLLNRCQEHTEITGWLKWKLISHEVS